MQDYVYDNCEKILGSVKNVTQYVKDSCDDYEEIEDIIEELKYFEEDTMIVLDYNNGMGFMIDYWTEKDKHKLEEVE